jgi:predicted RNA-binding protein YlqC (UPF0109 family)
VSADAVPTAVAVCEFVCKAVVEHPDDVSVEVTGDDDRYELTVTVADGDTGRVIGRRGRTAQAIRAVVRAAAAKDGKSVDVEFAD